MAVVLGYFNENKLLKIMKENVGYKVKVETIHNLILTLEEQVEMAQDIYDTYYYIKDNDENFSKELWKLLCRNKVANIDINSYFAWKIGYDGYVMLSRYGVSVHHQSIKNDLMIKFGLDEKQIYRGRALLADYIVCANFKDNVLDRMIEDLQTFVVSFKQYADDFFNSVSSYKVKKID
jgi:hypothetical protein